MVTIYQFRMYSVTEDSYRVSRRWGTREGVEALGGKIMENTAVEVDDALVGADIPGLTVIDFNPHPRSGFQRTVRFGY